MAKIIEFSEREIVYLLWVKGGSYNSSRYPTTSVSLNSIPTS